jgi:MFS family permease
MFALSKRFGALADRFGPRAFMGFGPLVAAAGLAWFARMGADVDYAVDVLPGLLVFALGLSMTVAPLTTTVLDSVEERHVGVASGVNNAVSRTAGVLAIAALGAIVSAQFASAYDGPPGTAGDQPLAGGTAEISAASTSAFHLGMGICAGVMAIGGGVALAGVRNPARPSERRPSRGPGSAATAGECGRCPEGLDERRSDAEPSLTGS